MAQLIIIPEGTLYLDDYEMYTPDTKVNHRANIKYPVDVFDCSKQNSIVESTWDEPIVYPDGEEDEITFANPNTEFYRE